MQKGISDIIMSVIAAALLISFGFALLATRPFWGVYDELPATAIAESIATDISALSISDTGSIVKEFKAEWDIEISKKKIQIKHEKKESKKIDLSTQFDMQDVNLVNVKKLSITREKAGIVLRKI